MKFASIASKVTVEQFKVYFYTLFSSLRSLFFSFTHVLCLSLSLSYENCVHFSINSIQYNSRYTFILSLALLDLSFILSLISSVSLMKFSSIASKIAVEQFKVNSLSHISFSHSRLSKPLCCEVCGHQSYRGTGKVDYISLSRSFTTSLLISPDRLLI